MAGLTEALNRIEFEIREHDAVLDKKGEVVADIPAWFIHSLRSYGSYRKPSGYLSQAERIAQEKLEEQRAILAAEQESANLAAEAANLAFNRWRDTLTPEEVENLVNGIPGPREQALKHAWRKQQERRQS